VIHTNNTADDTRTDGGLGSFALLIAAAVALVLIAHSTSLAFLQDLSPDSKVAGVQFSDGVTFFKNLRGGFVGIGIPGSICALTAAGLLWLTGSRLAKTFAGAVLGGVLLVLFAPSIVA
jgi:hypothetical protein